MIGNKQRLSELEFMALSIELYCAILGETGCCPAIVEKIEFRLLEKLEQDRVAKTNGLDE